MPALLQRIALVLLALGTIHFVLSAQPHQVAVNQGPAATWQAIQKLRTFASVLHTTAHPDDEHGGVLTWLSRGLGVRVSLLTLTRGESGDNALGAELFDALGLIRTEELLAANRYYGVDQQYFTSAIDYGFSKRVSEAWSQWTRTKVLEEVVRVIRMNRPLVVVSRFQGEPRDGHGQHIAAGEITLEAFHVAADPERFPEQLVRGGLRPWQAHRLYVGGIRTDEPASIEIDVSEYSPWLGLSYRRLARLGLGLQRSQNSGRSSATPGAAIRRYQRIWPLPGPEQTNSGFFDGLETDWESLGDLAGRQDSPSLKSYGRSIGAHVEAAVAAFSMQRPQDSIPALTAGLRETRELLAELEPGDEASFLLLIKDRQFEHALSTALGLELFAVAVPTQTEPGTPTELPVVVPGQKVAIDLSLTSPRTARISEVDLHVDVPSDWRTASNTDTSQALDGTTARRILVTVGSNTRLSRRSFTRTALTQFHYTRTDPTSAPFSAPKVVAVATFRVDGVRVTIRSTVQGREAQLPYGYVLRELQVLPSVSLSVKPSVTIVPKAQETVSLTVEVERTGPETTAGTLVLNPPPGWEVRPARVTLAKTQVDERFEFTLHRINPTVGEGTVTVVANLDGKIYREGYQTITYPDLETRYLFREAYSVLRGVDVKLPDNLTVGYIMGVGDDIPAAIRQLGSQVRLLESPDLETGQLDKFDAIIIGTRGYAVRPELHRGTDRLLGYAERGGNLIVLYNTEEFDPNRYAPFPAELPRRPEEVTEEDAAINILEPNHPVLQWPNRIVLKDFEGWVEQRGSKFLSTWAPAYTPIVSSHDLGQPPQQGGWLTARHGRGNYTYFAYALHRQLPFGIPGAYRILANLISMGRNEGSP
jgi:LmbE family N-acetylglucosaminyl deacetylase